MHNPSRGSHTGSRVYQPKHVAVEEDTLFTAILRCTTLPDDDEFPSGIQDAVLSHLLSVLYIS